MSHPDRQDDWEFGGFSSPNTTPIPDEFFDVLAPRLKEAELRVLLYIMRRTFGFKKTSDSISLRQMTEGVRTADGRILDEGTGLSKKAVIQAIRSLVRRKIIIATPRQSPEKGTETTTYRLNIIQPPEITTPGCTKVTGGGYPSTPGGVTLGNPQETVKQQTVKQDVVVRGRASCEARPAHTDGPDQERQEGRAQESEHLVQELRKRGVSAGRAKQLVGRHPAEHIEAKMRLLDRLLAEGSDLVGRNPPGFLVRAIEEDYRYGEEEGSGDDLEGIWGRVVELMEGVVERPSQLEFIRDSRLLRVGEREAVVQGRDKYAASVVGEMLGPEIEGALLQVLGRRVRLRVVVG